QQHLVVILTNSLGAAAQLLGRLPAVAEFAEVGRKPKLLLLGDALAAKDQHEVPGPGLFDRAHRARGKLLGQIDSLDLRAAGGRQRRDLYVDDIVHGTILRRMKTLSRSVLSTVQQSTLSGAVTSWMMLFSVSAASPARRPALPDQAIAVVEKEGLDLGLDLAQRGDDVLRLFASHEDGLGLDDVGIVADEVRVLPQ